jgi:hypothetical protein
MTAYEYEEVATDTAYLRPKMDGPVIAAINRLAARLLAALAPLCWAALIVLFAYAELQCD